MSDDQTEDLTLLGQSGVKPPDSPDQAEIETFKNTHPNRDYSITFHCPEFTAVCPITGQPDFGTITIEYIPDETCIESKALKLYLHAFRNQGIFHENVVNRILDDLVKACAPRAMIVNGSFNARGGIAIDITAEHEAD